MTVKTETRGRKPASREPKEFTLIDGVYYNVYKAAPLLLMSWQSLLRIARQKKITYMKKGGLFLFKPQWLQDYLHELTVIGCASGRLTK